MAAGNVLPVLTILYRVGWALAAFAARAPARGKLARALRGRRAAPRVLAEWAARGRVRSRPLVWFHAASVGEGRQAEAVLRRVAAARPDWQMAYTYGSPSAERFAAGLPVAVAGFVPFDTVRDTAAALDALRPAALVFSATDIWPELVRAAAARGVALGVVSATLAPTSSRRGVAARALLRHAYAALDRVGAIAEADADALARLGARAARIAVTGDTRHDAALERLAAADPEAPHLRALRGGNDRPLVLAGSTWPPDERVLLPALADLWRRGARFRLALAPHEPTAAHLAALERRLRRHLGAECRVVRLSSLLGSADSEPLATRNSASRNWDAVVVDRVGILAELYQAASIAYVGGGFHAGGLHSVIEPAAAGVPVLFGPRWRGSRDARLLLDAGAARTVRDARELVAVLAWWLEDEAARATAGAAARAVVEGGAGAAERSAQLVIDLVEQRPLHPNPYTLISSPRARSTPPTRSS
jgi:3-deoxy-D-manno-octulosonic-acid transferase